MKTVDEILAEIDRLFNTTYHDGGGEYEDGMCQAWKMVKAFILEPSAECDHEWYMRPVGNPYWECSKCGATK